MSTSSVKIAAALLDADFGRLAEEISAITDAGADSLHIDVMDGQFAPNITVGPPIVAQLRSYSTIPLDVHLMVRTPEAFVRDFAEAGADIITVHVEAAAHPLRALDMIRDLGCRPGIALSPGTSEDALEFMAEHADLALVLGVNPGFGEQPFISDMLRKIQNVRAMMGNRDVQVEGGVNEHTAAEILAAGANVLVAGRTIFGHTSYLEAIESLRGAAENA